MIEQTFGPCIEFAGCKDSKGYGLKRVGSKLKKAHRLAWEETHGEIPDGMIICHHCDNPACVNVGHLFLGTYQDNMDDKIRKGRQSPPLRGEANGYSKLTEDVVHYIKKMRGKTTQTELAKKFGVAQATISDIQAGRTWQHV